MNVKIAVCEDCQKDAELLCRQLSRYCRERTLPLYQVDVYESGHVFSEQYDPAYSLIFMDIYLEHEDGMQVVRNLQKAGLTCPVIFFTRSTDHAIEAFNVNALHYLTKPLIYSKLVQALDRWREFCHKQAGFFLLHTEKDIRKILLHDIVFIEVFNNTSVVHLTNEAISSRVPLKDLEDTIRQADAHPDFLRCHRSYLINMNRITAYKNPFFVLDTGALIPVSKYRRGEVLRIYEDFALHKIKNIPALPTEPEGGGQ